MTCVWQKASAMPGSKPGSYQAHFHQRWHHLHDPHVRALAWLLDAPDLLDVDAPCWQGKIATLPAGAAQDADNWLRQLDADPSALHTTLDVQRFTRLGRYAEKLLACYFAHQGVLHQHGVQVRAGKDDTVGEFDFLLKQGQTLLHWEFATKFYLLHTREPALPDLKRSDYFVGPNLADTLGAKMRKILDRQLALGKHPAAQAHLSQPLLSAQALVKGWLFYRRGETLPASELGLSLGHCRGWWCSLQEMTSHVGPLCAILPRLSWLAPARLDLDAGVSSAVMQAQLTQQFHTDPAPVMLVTLRDGGDCLLEAERGFVVPDDWQGRANQRLLASGMA